MVVGQSGQVGSSAGCYSREVFHFTYFNIVCVKKFDGAIFINSRGGKVNKTLLDVNTVLHNNCIYLIVLSPHN